MSHMTAITHCKTVTCREAITTSDVLREQPVDGAPQHVVIVYRCPACERTDRMVGTIESWREIKSDQAVADVHEKALSNRVTKMAHIEVNAINTVNDLLTLWRSYKQAPLIEDVMGSCMCDNCKARREI